MAHRVVFFSLFAACAAPSVTPADPMVPESRVDADLDGYNDLASGGNDCDDADPDVHPGAEDLDCDGVDADCYHGDGPDEDGDLVTVCDGDCRDQDRTVGPGFPELCDGLDSDCNLIIDDAADADGDGVPACDAVISAPVRHVAGEGGDLPVGAALLVVDLNSDGRHEVLATEAPGHRSAAGVWLYTSRSNCLMCASERIDLGEFSALSAVRAGDLQGDGLQDVVVVGELSPGSPDRGFRVLKGERGPGLAPWRAWAEVGDAAGAATLGDLDGDGLDELVMYTVNTFTGTRVSLASGGAAPVPVEAAGLTLRPGTELVSVDLDGNGAWELAFSASCEAPEAQALITSWPPVPSPQALACTSWTYQTAFASPGDVDGDGFDDLALGGLNDDGFGDILPSLTLVLGAASPDAQQVVDLPLTNLEVVRAIAGVAGPDPLLVTVSHVGDLGGPGVTVVRVWEVRRVAGVAVPTLLQSIPLGQRASMEPVSVASGDLDGDGWAEVVVGETSPQAADPGRPGNGRLLVFSTRRDCDDHDPTIQRGCGR